MEIWQSALLGIIQGVTEFFPVSSSAHLKLARFLLGIEGTWLYFDLACHFGSWFALVFFMRNKLMSCLKNWRQFFLALIPLVPAYIIVKSLHLFEGGHTGYYLILSGGLLFLGMQGKNYALSAQKSFLLIGSMQALALMPGVSRSGATMLGGRLLGKSWLDAAEFSFLLAIPTILGGEIIETAKALKSPLPIPWDACIVGAIFSFLTAMLAIRIAFRVYEKGTLAPFAWYCIGIGLMMIGLYG
jgi:undecaprenyl-diphosphatase